MPTHSIRVTYDKFCADQPLTDSEIDEAVVFFHDLAQKLESLGPRFAFAFREAHEVHFDLTEFSRTKAHDAEGQS